MSRRSQFRIQRDTSLSVSANEIGVARRISIFVKKAPPKPTRVFDTYWRFATERQRIFHARAAGQKGPWTDDPVLIQHKFTNAYRASDRTSQYLIRNVIYAGPDDWESTLIRVLLFKIFNKAQTWELLETKLGNITAQTFSAARINDVLDEASAHGQKIYSNAYIMPSGPANIRESRKHRMHTALLESILRGPIGKNLTQSNSMERAFGVLRGIPGFGPFLAFQFLIDLNYTPFLNFSEMDFVVPGPGARDGIQKCFSNLGDYDETGTIAWVTDRQEQEFSDRDLNFQSLWGRRLQLIDCQNLFCEVDKYARVVHPDVLGLSGRTRIKQKFVPNMNRFAPWFPPKWNINEHIPML